MSNLIVPNQAKLNWMRAQIETIPTLADCWLRLYKQPLVITPATTLAVLEAAQATYPGYQALPLSGWTDAVVVNSKAITEADTLTYEASAESEGDIYGCYATNGAGDRLWFCSAFGAGVPVPFNAELQVDVQLDLASVFN